MSSLPDEAASEPVPDELEVDEAGQLRLAVEEADQLPEDSASTLSVPVDFSDDRPPRLTRVALKHFKSFHTLTAELSTFNVLVGANNAGKSTLLQAISLIYTLLKLHRQGDTLLRAGRLVPTSALPVANLRDMWFQRRTRQGRAANIPIVLRAEFSDGSYVQFAIRLVFGNANSRMEAEQGMSGTRLRALLAHPAVWVPSAVGIVRDEEYRTTARREGLVNAGRHNEVIRNLLLALYNENHQGFSRLQEILAQRFNADLGDVRFEEDLDQFVTAEYRGASVRHDLYSAGAGFIQVVQLLAFVLTRSPSIVLLDEPDAHLHSSLQRIIIEVLEELSQDTGVQVLLATHSKEIINFVDPSRLLLVRSGEERVELVGNQVTPITVLRGLGAIDNVDAYTLLRNRRCLFVEGPDDEVVLSRLAAKLGLRHFSGDDRVVAIPVGGADRFEHVTQLDVLEQFLGHEIASLEVRDRDGRTEEHRTRAVEQARRPLHILQRDSIESYLLCPAILARTVNQLLEERNRPGATDGAAIEEMILQISEELRPEVEDRCAERYSLDVFRAQRSYPDIKEANQAARALVQRNWQQLDQRLEVVSGKTLLRRVRAAIQNRYGVNFGNERLAESYLPDEIPQELAEVLTRVGQL